ncbi:uncharacterized protein LOC123257652 [Drosophila ananassae]|uniref:uncharacterized protein LOC123257652 n=1 Tax=Drosophila ananassae TaxID=7217 RepID=UPI001CFFC11A|nr:uncharacterized protein LOC123257652 [Drosophila ananassae]
MTTKCIKDIYESTIHNKANLTNTHKFHRLKSLLIDEAANLVRHLAITDSAYNTAWERLNERYNRPRHIVNSLLEQFMKLPTTTRSDTTTLRKVSDGANEIVRGLDAIEETGRDCWIIYLTLEKLDADTRRRWIERSVETDSPTPKEFFKFLDARCEELELSKRETIGGKTTASIGGKTRKVTHSLVVLEGNKCSKCHSTEHRLYGCQQFLDMSAGQRVSFAKENALCYNCLNPGHGVRKCKSTFKCRQCKGQHHSLLHLQRTQQAIGTIAQTGEDQEDPSAHSTVTTSHIAQAEGSAAIVCPQGTANIQQSTGWNRSTLPTAMVNVRNANGDLVACRLLLDTGSELSYIYTNTWFGSYAITHTDQLVVQAQVLGRITSSLERQAIDESALRVFNDLQLADSQFSTNAPIDILLGSEHVWSVTTGRKIYDNKGKLIAISSIFGWVITSLLSSRACSATALTTTINIDAYLRRFWELESIQRKAEVQPEDEEVEKHFLATHTRDEQGKYIVELPFKVSETQFADTLQRALQRFKSVERRLAQNQQLCNDYVKFMRKYQELGHMREISPSEIPKGRNFYLPHHPVLGRKLRVVFDGSYQDAKGMALNDTLSIGPSIQRDLFAVCLRFRMYKYVFSADIVKMFRQIWDFYVDDVLTGGNSEDELLRNRDELVQLMSCANLELGKWVSNTKRIESEDNTDSSQSSVKVLGLHWHPREDTLSYNVNLSKDPRCTKRQVLSDVSHKRIQGEGKSNCLAAQTTVTTNNPWDKLLNRNSSWLKLIHTLVNRMKHLSSKQTSNSLTFDEIKAARIRWLQHAKAGFQQEFQLLRANKALGNQSQLVKLSPIIDKDNLLRVGGRIQHSQLSAEAKHPMLLPKNASF